MKHTRTIKALSTPLAALFLIGSAFVAGSNDTAHADTGDGFTQVTTWFAKRPCYTEDSVNCAWDARQLGNGTGHSFITREFKSQHLVCIMYKQYRFARHNDYCWTTIDNIDN